MKNRKIILSIIIVLIIIFIIILTTLILIYRRTAQQEQISDQYYPIDEIETDKTLNKVSSRNEFYMVQTCVNKFYLSRTKEVNNMAVETNAQYIYSLLDEEYISQMNITTENVLEKIPLIDESIVNINNMYVNQKTNNISVYIVEGVLREQRTSKLSDFEIMVKIDTDNKSFSIMLQDYIDQKFKDWKIGEDLQVDVPTNIEIKDFNIYDFDTISDATYVTDLYNKYIEEALYNQELAYEHLDKQYREQKYGSLENFKAYADNNVIRYVTMELDKYQKSNEDNYTQYVCIDTNGNYYIFRETAVMEYTLILDTYTIDLPEFIQKYQSASETEKVGLNIQKVFDAINDGDYKYVYNKLDPTFKNNNFKTLTAFEDYVKKNFYESNKLSFGQYQKSGNLYAYDVTITDNTSQNQINKTIIMQLKENTDFVMSFNVN